MRRDRQAGDGLRPALAVALALVLTIAVSGVRDHGAGRARDTPPLRSAVASTSCR
jgi:hypothetical protein